jgi:hypothetical protein
VTFDPQGPTGNVKDVSIVGREVFPCQPQHLHSVKVEFVVMPLVTLLLDPTRVIPTTVDLDDDVLVREVELDPSTGNPGPRGLSDALRIAALSQESTEQAFRFTL